MAGIRNRNPARNSKGETCMNHSRWGAYFNVYPRWLRRAFVFSLLLFTLVGTCAIIALVGWPFHAGVTQGFFRNTDRIRGSGIEKTEQRALSPFTSIEVNGSFEIYITGQKDQRVTVTGDDNLLPFVIAEAKGQRLCLRAARSWSARKRIKVDIEARNIDSLSSFGASDISASGLSQGSFTLDMNGSGKTRLSGKTKKLTATLSGTGILEAGNFHAQGVSISVSGAGSADVYAGESLNAGISGVGNVYYHGNPAHVTRNISGVGLIQAR